MGGGYLAVITASMKTFSRSGTLEEGRTHLLLVLVVWPLTSLPFRDEKRGGRLDNRLASRILPARDQLTRQAVASNAYAQQCYSQYEAKCVALFILRGTRQYCSPRRRLSAVVESGHTAFIG